MTPAVAAAMIEHITRDLKRLLDEWDRIEAARLPETKPEYKEAA